MLRSSICHIRLEISHVECHNKLLTTKMVRSGMCEFVASAGCLIALAAMPQPLEIAVIGYLPLIVRDIIDSLILSLQLISGS